MKLVIGLFVLLLAIAIAAKLSTDTSNINLLPFFRSPTVKVHDQTFKVTLAKTPKEKEVGLSEKTSLPEDSGMLFEFDKEDYYPFWMKNMKIPIDIVYIRGNKVASVFEKLQPPKTAEEPVTIVKPDEPVTAVLEINAGLSEKYSIKKGDEVTIKK